MKKSQILAALALAFALGVVAPVAGTYAAEGDTCTTDDGKAGKEDAAGTCVADATTPTGPTVDQIQATATKTELTNAITNASNNKAVAAYKTMQTATATGKEWSDISEGTLMKNLNDAIDAIYKANIDGVEAPEDYEAAKTLADAIKDAEGVKNLIPEYQALIAAVTDKVNVPSYDKLVELAGKAGLKVTLPEGVEKDVIKLREAIAGNATYQLYAALNGALTAANTSVSDQAKHIKDLKEALAYADDVITPTMISEAATVTKDNTTPVANLVALAKTALKSARGQKYAAVLDEITTAQGVADKAGATGEEYANALKDLNTDYKAATGTSLSIATPAPDQNPDEPGTDEPGTDEPGTDDPSAPGTGVVSAAEGNAATTVSIVAGLATALTALGAGVVAYRSARRSNK